MSTPYVGECRLVGFNFQVADWSYCNGSAVAISQNPTLFNLIGTTYGGDGQETFLLPDLQGRVPVHQGAGYALGQKAGVENVTLSVATMASHNHVVFGASGNGGSNFPTGNLPAANQNAKLFVSPATVDQAMNASMIGLAGGNLPHENMQPYLVMNWIISLFGVYPSPN